MASTVEAAYRSVRSLQGLLQLSPGFFPCPSSASLKRAHKSPETSSCQLSSCPISSIFFLESRSRRHGQFDSLRPLTSGIPSIRLPSRSRFPSRPLFNLCPSRSRPFTVTPLSAFNSYLSRLTVPGPLFFYLLLVLPPTSQDNPDTTTRLFLFPTLR